MTISTRNILLEFFEEQREKFGRTYTYWAERWGIKHPATVARWAKGDRRIGPRHRHVFKDLPFTMDEYYASTPASDPTQARSDVKQFGRTNSKSGKKGKKALGRPAGVVTKATAAKRERRVS